MFVKDGTQPIGRIADSFIYTDCGGFSLSDRTLIGAFHTPRFRDGQCSRAAFGAQSPQIGRMLFISGEFDNAVTGDFEYDSAANAAVRADTFYFFVVMYIHPTEVVFHSLEIDPGFRLGPGFSPGTCYRVENKGSQ